MSSATLAAPRPLAAPAPSFPQNAGRDREGVALPAPAQQTDAQAAARARHVDAALKYGARAANLPEWSSHAWDDLAPLLGGGWAGRHHEVCGCADDWRLTFPQVKHGWESVRCPR